MKSADKVIEQAVEELLRNDPLGRSYALHVAGSRPDGDWLHVVVAPGKPGIPAYAFAELLAHVEQSVRESEKKAEILLIPASN